MVVSGPVYPLHCVPSIPLSDRFTLVRPARGAGIDTLIRVLDQRSEARSHSWKARTLLRFTELRERPNAEHLFRLAAIRK